MIRKLSSAALSMALIAAPVFAASDHEHGHAHETMTQEAASTAAVKKRDELIKAGKLEASWGSVAVKSVEQKTFKKGPEWVVTLQNEAVSDPTKRTLYMFYDMSGHYLAANFTGN
jgi:hypothetical protein